MEYISFKINTNLKLTGKVSSKTDYSATKPFKNGLKHCRNSKLKKGSENCFPIKAEQKHVNLNNMTSVLV